MEITSSRNYIILFVFCLLIAFSSASQSHADWPQQGYGSGRSSFNPNEYIIGPNKVPHLEVIWKNSVSCTINTGPTNVNGIVYYGDYCGTFWAVNEETGATIWTQSISKTESGHAVYDGVVYVAGGTLYAFDAVNGSSLWTWNQTNYRARHPVVYNGVVYFGMTSESSNDSFIQALEAKTGNELWSAPDAGVGAVDGGKVYSTTDSSTEPNDLKVFNAENGNLLWKALVNHSNHLSTPSVRDGFVYVHSGDGYLYAFNADGCGANECLPLWRAQVPGNTDERQLPSVDEDNVYVGAGDSFYAFSASGCGAAECQPLWTTKTDCSYFRGRNSPSIANGVVYSTCGSNYIYAFDATNGEILWSYYASTSGYDQRAAPAISNGRLFHAATFNFNIYAFEPTTGWTQKNPLNYPPARNECGITYDSKNEVTVLFGGIGGGTQGDTWTWDGNNWSRVATTGPSPRFDVAMAYDSMRNVVVLFGGVLYHPETPTLYGDTWEWDGSTWTQVATTGPSPRRGMRMAFDSSRGVMVMYGGNTGAEPFFNDTWEWDGTNWTQVIATGPSARIHHSMAFDVLRGITILYGGSESNTVKKNDTWAWDGVNWTLLAPTGPSAMNYADMVYDGDRGVIVLFGGGAGGVRYDETWEWDGTTWKQVTVPGPRQRAAHNMAYHAKNKTVVLYGGWDGQYLSDTWEFKSLFPSLSILIPSTATEGDGIIQGTVSIPTVLNIDLTVNLTSSDTSEVNVPLSVTINSGDTSAVFDLTILDDNLFDDSQTVTVTANARGYSTTTETIAVSDNEQKILSLSIPHSATEGVGNVQGSISIPGIYPSDLVVSLNSNDISEVAVPMGITVMSGQSTAIFDLTVLDDKVFDSTQTVQITATATDWTPDISLINVLDIDDADEDELPDSWETQYFGDLSQENDGDYDEDGTSNLYEYNDGSNPANKNPDQPLLIAPADLSINVSLTPTFETNPFSDPEGDSHENTVWEISDQLGPVFTATSTKYFTELNLPDLILNENTQYFWQVRFEDDMGAKSSWSDEWEFTTGADQMQWTDGVPDQQVLDPLDPVQNTLDLNGDGTEDINQPQHENWKCLNSEAGTGQVGVEGKDVDNVDSVDSVISIDPASIADTVNMPDTMPFGLITFKLTVINSDQPATVTLYSTIDIPSNAEIYKYSPERGWYVYPYAIINRPPNDYHYIEMTLWDGGDGDADGLKNGFIIDPVGAGVVSSGGGGGGGG